MSRAACLASSMTRIRLRVSAAVEVRLYVSHWLPAYSTALDRRLLTEARSDRTDSRITVIIISRKAAVAAA